MTITNVIFRAGVFLLVLGARVLAQSEPAPVALAPVEVTGTRVGRSLAESPIGATVISREALLQTGRARLAEVLRELPEFPGNPVSDLIPFGSARGVMAADLRGLGTGNTLVLVNGRRATVNASAFDQITTFVDMNRFSPAFIERLEILKGGASAIYGADAVGGVINIITRRQPAGGEVSISYGNTFKTDAAEISASLATGVTRGRLGLSIGLDYFQRHAQAHVDRSFTRSANMVPRYVSAYDFYAALPPEQIGAYDGRSLNSGNARFAVGPGQVNGQNGVSLPGLVPGAVITALPGTGGLAMATPNFATPYRAATGGQFAATAATTFVVPELTRGDPGARNLFDYNPLIWTLPAAERTGAMARFDYELSKTAAFFGEAAGGRHRSRTQYHPRDSTEVVPRTNAFNPFGVDVTAAWRIPDRGPRRSLTVDDHAAAQLGLRHGLDAALTWEITGNYSRDEFMDTTTGVYHAGRVRTALASANPATALNPFGGREYGQAPAVLDTIATEAWFGGRADLLTLDAQAAGRFFQLPGGAIRTSAFVEARRERFSAVSDAASRAGDILGAGVTGADGDFSRSVVAVAAETYLPLLPASVGENRGPRLALEAAARQESFPGSFHSGVRPTIGAVFRPSQEVLFRGSAAWTFRAPTLPQLFSPQNDTLYNSIPDLGRPAALTGDPFDGPNVSRLVRQGGNPNLSAESGRVYQAGAVWEPRAVAGLTLEAMWFRYDLENIISGVGPAYILQNERGGLGALVHREPGSEIYVNRTAAPIAVISGAAGQTTAVAPGQSATVPGRLKRIDIFTVNLSRKQLVGWDFAVRQTGSLFLGRITSVAAIAYTDKTQFAYDQQTPFINYAGAVSNPRWRGRASADWVRRAWSLGATMAYTASSGYHDSTGYYQKPYRLVHLRASYTTAKESWIGRMQFSVGVEDVFNEAPPLYPDHPIGFNYGQVTRPQGRFWRMTARRTW